MAIIVGGTKIQDLPSRNLNKKKTKTSNYKASIFFQQHQNQNDQNVELEHNHPRSLLSEFPQLQRREKTNRKPEIKENSPPPSPRLGSREGGQKSGTKGKKPLPLHFHDDPTTAPGLRG